MFDLSMEDSHRIDKLRSHSDYIAASNPTKFRILVHVLI